MNKRIGLMFAGQGAQFPGMGKDLCEAYSNAAEIFQRANDAMERDIAALCFDGTLEDLTCCANCQPAIFTVSIACLAALKQERPDFAPAICGGLSLGEYAALTAAGAYDFDTALNLVSKRGEFMDDACRASHGAMAALLKMPIDEVEDICARYDCDIANYNSPEQQIISGPEEKIAAALAELSEQGKMAKRLTVAGAYHSRLMQPAADRFAAVIQGMSARQPLCPVVQNITGTITQDASQVVPNLIAQISGSVKWESCAKTLMQNCDILVELGPGKVLAGLAKRIDRSFPVFSIGDVPSLKAFLDANID